MATTKLKINRGTTYKRTVTYKKDGVVTSLVGGDAYFTMKTTEFDSSVDDSTAIIKKDYLDLSGDDATNGIVVISIDPTDTNLLEPKEYYYDIKIKDPDGSLYKVDEGIIVLDGSPTNRA